MSLATVEKTRASKASTRRRPRLSWINVKREAASILQAAGFSSRGTPGARAILERTPGVRIQRVPSGTLPGGAEGQCCRVEGQFLLLFCASLSPDHASFVVMHELAHAHLAAMVDRLRPPLEEIEIACDEIAAILSGFPEYLR